MPDANVLFAAHNMNIYEHILLGGIIRHTVDAKPFRQIMRNNTHAKMLVGNGNRVSNCLGGDGKSGPCTNQSAWLVLKRVHDEGA